MADRELDGPGPGTSGPGVTRSPNPARIEFGRNEGGPSMKGPAR